MIQCFQNNYKIKETEELLPSDIVEKMKFVSHLEALKIIHMPENKAQLLLAKQRLAYEEFFYFLLSMNLLKDEVSGQKNIHPMVHVEDAKLLMNQLPYRLTESQQNVFCEIEKQMCEGTTTVNRLIQGDVGSGKTELEKYLVGFIPEVDGIVSVEDTLELHLKDLYPNKDIYEMRISDNFKSEDAIKDAPKAE